MKSNPTYVGITPHAARVDTKIAEKRKKNEKDNVGEKTGKRNKEC